MGTTTKTGDTKMKVTEPVDIEYEYGQLVRLKELRDSELVSAQANVDYADWLIAEAIKLGIDKGVVKP